MKEFNGWLRSQPADALESIRVMATATGNEGHSVGPYALARM